MMMMTMMNMHDQLHDAQTCLLNSVTHPSHATPTLLLAPAGQPKRRQRGSASGHDRDDDDNEDDHKDDHEDDDDDYGDDEERRRAAG